MKAEAMKENAIIVLAKPNQCTGCAACVSVCPTNSVIMREDKEGFLQPHIDNCTCIKCHKCEKTCPVISPLIQSNITAYAYNAQTKDKDALHKSSSGGAFYELSRFVIAKGGVVFGVRFDGIHVIHDYAETLEGIEPFMGSKYIQSEIGNTFLQAKFFLEQDKWVLFSGTPCQIAGLKRFLSHYYEKLITVDLICHGVPSPGIWEKYITRLMKKIQAEDIRDIRFRRKITADEAGDWFSNFFYYYFFFLRDKQWHTFGETRRKNLFYQYFSRHLFRPSCYQCPYRDIYTPYSDITIGDSVASYQQSQQTEMPSTIIVHTIQGEKVIESIMSKFDIFEVLPLEDVNKYYEREKQSTKTESFKRPWKLSNFMAMLLPLEYFKWIWMHDKFHIVIKRKIRKLCKKNTR